MAKRASAKKPKAPAKEAKGNALVETSRDFAFKQLVEATWIPDNASEQEMRVRVSHAYRLMQQLGPEDAGEEMLTSQMVAAHGAAMEQMRRAMLPDRPAVMTEKALKEAKDWMGLYLRQLAVLDKHRGKGQQKVVVEHFHVEAGAQAVFGGDHQASMPKDVTPTKRSATNGYGREIARRNGQS